MIETVTPIFNQQSAINNQQSSISNCFY